MKEEGFVLSQGMHVHLLCNNLDENIGRSEALTSHTALVVVNDESCPLAMNCAERWCFQL